ncbi:hypothetical protein QBC34DRAFT_357226 [Podospora aff. communis PSN243]|uniref:Uncharacterized protein n=1 Tax=Podospora aff. communis PSN243 TaxID=3040156 RepID=A0AAV9GFP9_9PEZI|nr:hypothetical protein QBC34DRAFT_357226 [Podospora aff. communis PSN243]
MAARYSDPIGVSGPVPQRPGVVVGDRHEEKGAPTVESTLLRHSHDNHSPDTQSRHSQDSQSHEQETAQNTTRKPPGWPTTPVELKSTGWGVLFSDITSVLLSVPFLVLAVALMRLDGVRVDEWRQTYTNAILVAATLFPLVFASVAGRLTSQVARWKLERGSPIESLEQWLQSRTVFTAIYTQIRLSLFNVAAVALVLVWISSPLGSQSVQRQLGTIFEVDETAATAEYFGTDAPSGFVRHLAVSPGTANGLTAWTSVLNALYSVALFAPNDTRMAPTDVWGNLKIPLLSSHHPSRSGPEWSYTAADSPTVFSSLAGLPMPRMPQGNSTFTIESSYLQLICDPAVSNQGFRQTEIQPFPNNQNNFTAVPGNQTLYGYRFNQTLECPNAACPDREATWWLALEGLYVNPNWTSPGWHSERYGVNWKSQYELTTPAIFRNETGLAASQATLVLGTIERTAPPFLSQDVEGLVTCTVSQPYVQSRVECLVSALDANKPSCRVTAQRPSQQPHPSSNITHLSFFEVFRAFSGSLPRATGFRNLRTIQDPTLYYLASGSATRFLEPDAGLAPSERVSMLSSASASDISIRFTQLLNTYLLLSQTVADVDSKTGNLFDVSAERAVTGAATSTRLVEVYTVSWSWAGLFLAAAAVLLVCAVAGIVFAHLAVVPDILGFASSSVRDARYIQLPRGAGGLDGMDLSRALKGEEVQYGVVETGEESSLGVSWKGSVDRVRRGGRHW